MKKRFFGVFAALCLCLTLLPTAALADTGSTTVQPDYSWYTADASEFTVTTAAQLLGFANLVNGADGKTATDFADKTVKLGADIDLSGIANWTPIGKNGAVFSGTFDGQRKTISKLTVNSTGEYYVGLFGRTVGATVQNLAVSGSVTGTGTYSEVGGIVGSLGGGSIKNCSFSGSVTGSGNYVGGIAGETSGNPIENCSVSGSVTGSGSNCRVGGIAGLSSGLISKCKNIAKVSGSGSAKALGGIVGDIGNDIKIRYCCNQGELTNYGWYVGGLVGRLTGVYSDTPLRSCYTTFDVDALADSGYGAAIGCVDNDNPITVSGIYIPVPENEEASWVGKIEGSDTTIIGEGESKSTDAFASGEVAWLLQNAADASDGQVWGQMLTGSDKDAYPVLADESGSNTVYKVTFVDDDGSTVKYLNGGTITVSEPARDNYTFGGWYTAATGGTRVTAISSDLCDTGDGADANSITLYADWVAVDYSWYNESASEFTVSTAEQLLGFANLVNGAGGKTATDFADKTVKLGADIDLSGIANWTPIGKNGAVFSGTFDGQNHKISGLTVNSDAVYVGLFGRTVNATVQNLAVSGSVTGTGASSSVGGIIGDLSGGSIKSCSFSGSVTGSGSCVGGIVGEASGTISRCSNTATVSGSAFSLGGIVGSSQADIQYCCNQGDISSTRTGGSYIQVGGIGGKISMGSSTISMKSCYNTGATAAKINATYASIGGIVGQVNVNAALKVTNAYYLNGSVQNWLGETGGYATGSVVGKDATAFSSGEVTYLLNGSKSTSPVWYQTLSGEDTDSLPTLDMHGVVYYGYTSCAEDNDAKGYGNGYLSSTSRPAHQFKNGSCKNCSATFTITADKPSYTYGDTATLTIAMTGVAGEKTYQWSKQVGQDYNTISGATSETYITPMLTESGVYKCNVTVDGVRIYSSIITLTVNKKTATTPALDAKSATYTGSPIEHELESLPTGVASAKYEYEGMNGTTYPKSETAPTAAGEYSVTVTFTMQEGYEQLAPATSTLTIQPKPSSGSSRPSYSVTVPETTNGSVTVSPKSAKKGATVTVTVAPDSGYTLETLTVLDKNGNAIELTDLGDGKYSFKMPAGKVSIEASFMDDNTMLSFFTDVPANAYYYDAVLWAARNGITGGIDENHFGPDLSCARAQLVTFLYRVAVATGADVSVGEDTNILSYTDALDIPEYAIEALQWAVGAGIVNGADGKLMPSDTITREQFVTILYRFAKSVGMDTSAGADTNILSYGDALEISEYAVEAMQWAVGAGIMQGYDGDLMPKDSCTRAQIVTMLYRLLGE